MDEFDFSEFPDLDDFNGDTNFVFIIPDKKKIEEGNWIDTNEFSTIVNQMVDYSINIDNIQFVEKIVIKLFNNNDRILSDFISKCITDEQKNQLININDDVHLIYQILCNSNSNFVNNFLENNSKALDLCNKIGIDNFLFKGYIIPESIANSNFVFEQLKKDGLEQFRIKVNLLEEKSGINLENRVKKYYDSIINNIKNDDKENKDLLINLFYNYIFQDSKSNVLLNLNEMFRYLAHSDINLLDYSSLMNYRKVVNIHNLNIDEIKELLYDFKHKNIAEKYYDDMSKIKNHSYKRIVDNLYHFSNNQQNNELSKKSGIDIYELNGEQFNMMIRVTNNVYPSTEHLFDCYSLIGDGNLSHFHYENYDTDIIFGYTDFNYKNISGVLEFDSMTNQIDGRNSKYVNRIMTPEEIILGGQDRTGYSEININNELTDTEGKYKTIMPSYIVAFDNVTEKIINVAKTYNLPIVLINSSKYKNRKMVDENTFKTGLYDEEYSSEKITEIIDNIETNMGRLK